MLPTIGDKQLRGQQAAEDLLGTGKALWDVLTEEEQDDQDILQELDQQVFQCSVCDWWCEIGEMTEDHRCSDCGPEEED